MELSTIIYYLNVYKNCKALKNNLWSVEIKTSIISVYLYILFFTEKYDRVINKWFSNINAYYIRIKSYGGDGIETPVQRFKNNMKYLTLKEEMVLSYILNMGDHSYPMVLMLNG